MTKTINLQHFTKYQYTEGTNRIQINYFLEYYGLNLNSYYTKTNHAFMENNQLKLADISFEGKNYIDAYNKYSQIIESDINNKNAWIGKGISAGYMSESQKPTLDEVKVSLMYALKLNLTEDDKRTILEHLIPIAQNHINSLTRRARGIVDDKAKEAMPTGQLQLTRNLQQTAERYTANNEIFDSVYFALEFTNLAENFGATVDYHKKQIELIDTFLNDIKSEIHEEKKLKLTGFRNNLIKTVLSIDSTYTPPNQPNSGGCFIATELYSDYSHPKVIILRNFRDSYLAKSELGRNFISEYYRHSPLIANKLSNKKTLKFLIKKIFLEPLIWLVK